MTTKLKTKTCYDFEQLEELQRVAGKTFASQRTSRQRYMVLSWAFIFGGMGLFLIMQNYNAIISLFCLAFAAWMLVRFFFFYQLIAWSAKRSMKKEDVENEFIFEEDHILARQKQDSAKYPYNDCAHLMETDRNFYFIMESTGQGLMMDKQNVRGGSVDELRALLEEKCGKTPEFVKVK